MKKRVIAKAQKRKRRNKQKYAQSFGVIHLRGGVSEEKRKLINRMSEGAGMSPRAIAKIVDLPRRLVKNIIRHEEKK